MKSRVVSRYEQPSLDSGTSLKMLISAYCGYAVARGQKDASEMKYYAMRIRRYQKELGRKLDEFPELGIVGYS